MEAFIKGVVLGISLIVVIGAQNAFVIRQGLLKNHITSIIIVCLACDIVVMWFSVFGIGGVLDTKGVWFLLLGVCGLGFLVYYGFQSLRSAYLAHTTLKIESTREPLSRTQAIIKALALTLLNPNFYLDTFVIIGSVSATLEAKWAFFLGLISISTIWYFGVGYGVRVLLPLFTSHRAWVVFDSCNALILFSLAYYLGFSLYTQYV